MTAFVSHLTYDFRTGLRDRSLMLMNYLFPLAFYILVGLLMTGINPLFRDTLIPAMIVNAIMAGALLGLPNPIVSARELGIFRSFKINGVPALSIVSIPVISTLLHTALISAIIVVTAGPLFGARMPVQWGYFILVSLLTVFAIAGLGMLIGVVASNSRTTVLLAQLVYIPSMILGGLMLPTSMIPKQLLPVSMALPSTHAMNAWRGLSLGLEASFDPTISLLVLLTGGLISFGLAVYLFDWDSRNPSRKRSWPLAFLALLPYVLSALVLK